MSTSSPKAPDSRVGRRPIGTRGLRRCVAWLGNRADRAVFRLGLERKGDHEQGIHVQNHRRQCGSG